MQRVFKGGGNIATKEQILKELTIELSKKDFYTFCKYIDPIFFTDGKWYLKQIAYALQEVAEGKLKKLAISLPPRAGKSYIMSLYCAWVLGRDHNASIMRNSYAAKLAEIFSKDIRDGILNNPRYKEVFPDVVVSRTNSAVDAWALEGNTRPNYFCAGVGGTITGIGCNTIAILDDPVKNAEEALSPTTIENIWYWYTSTHLSRLEGDCAEIHIATRWNSKDPIGRLTDPYSEAYVPDMKVICIPALIDGKSYCEEVKTTEQYLQIKKVTPDVIWEAEYMQNPVETKGLLYNPSTLKRFNLADIRGKKPDAIISFCDTADKGTDSTSMPVGYIYREDVYIVDAVFNSEGVEVTEPLVAGCIERNHVEIANFESNNGGYQYSRNVKRILEERGKYCTIIPRVNMQNKETRILVKSGYVKEHFYFLSNEDIVPGSDYDRFFREFISHMRLGKNAHDDAVDSITGLAEYVEPLIDNIKALQEEKARKEAIDPVYGDPYKTEYDEIVEEFSEWEVYK